MKPYGLKKKKKLNIPDETSESFVKNRGSVRMKEKEDLKNILDEYNSKGFIDS